MKNSPDQDNVPCWYLRTPVQCMLLMLYLLPGRVRAWMARLLAGSLLSARSKRSHIIDVNLRYCLPELSKSERKIVAQEMARRFVRAVLDLPQLWFGSRARAARRLCIIGEEHLRHALKYQKAVILLTPHTVGLEYAGNVLAQRHPLLALTAPSRGRIAGWFMSTLRQRVAARVFRRGDSMLALLRELRAGRVLYYLPDEDLHRRARSVFVPYFGRMANVAIGGGRLVALSKACVLPCVTTLDPDTGLYTVRIDPPLDGLVDQPPAEICCRMRVELERLIRSAPLDYLWSQRIFHTRPDGSRNPDYARSSMRATATGSAR